MHLDGSQQVGSLQPVPRADKDVNGVNRREKEEIGRQTTCTGNTTRCILCGVMDCGKGGIDSKGGGCGEQGSVLKRRCETQEGGRARE